MVVPPTVGGRQLSFAAPPLGVVHLDSVEQLPHGVRRGRVAVLLQHVARVVLPGLLQQRTVVLRALQQVLTGGGGGYRRENDGEGFYRQISIGLSDLKA